MPVLAQQRDVWEARKLLLQYAENTFARKTKPLAAALARWWADWWRQNKTTVQPPVRIPLEERLKALLRELHELVAKQARKEAGDELRAYATRRFAKESIEDFVPSEGLAMYDERRENLVKGLADAQFEKLRGVVRQGIAEGQPEPEVAKGIESQIAQFSRGRLTTIARTETMTVYGAERLRVYREAEASGDVVGYEYDAVMDSRTTPICREYDGKRITAAELVHIPPLHFNCRTLLVPIFAWEGKLLSQKKYQLPASAAPMEGFGTDALKVGRAKPVLVASGLPKLKFSRDASYLGGAHAKEVWIDEEGNEYLFKPIERGGDEFVAHGEEAASKLARMIHPDVVEVRTVNLNGKFGTVQRIHTGLASKSDLSGMAPAELAQVEIEQLQREHVVDWLISNHDGHGKQFLRMADGKLLGIDKGQLYRYFPSDKLDVDYHPNARYGEQEPYYNTLFRSAKQGKVKVDPAVTLRYIEAVEAIDDEEFVRLLRPYAEGRFQGSPGKAQEFLTQALARKQGLRTDFEAYYSDVLQQKGFKFGPQPAIGRKGADLDSFAEETRRLGAQGKVLPTDTDEIEDQNALVFTEEDGEGRVRTVVKLKVRPQAEDKFLPGLQHLAVDEGARTRMKEDHYAEDFIGAAKTVSTHAGDGAYNQVTLNKMHTHLDDLQKLLESSNPDLRKMASHYLDWHETIVQAMQEKKQVSGLVSVFKPPKHTKKQEKAAEFTVARTAVKYNQRELKAGKARVLDDDASLSDAFGCSMRDGEQYEVRFQDGAKVRYRPWQTDNYYAHSGEMEIILEGEPTAERIQDALGRVEKLGLNTKLSTPAETELMYLTKQAYVAKIHNQKSWTNVIEKLDTQGASAEERVVELRKFWSKKLKVEDVTQLPSYQPAGEYQQGFLDREAPAGWRQQYRFDVSDEDLEREMAGYSLYHQVTRGSLEGLLDTALSNNGALVSTVEKMRLGLRPGGMSPQEDMNTGGASYVFTRIKKTDGYQRQAAGLYFKKRLLRRTDTISYDGDKYGRVTGDTVERYRKTTPGEWKRAAQSSNNETIFKYSVTLLDNVDQVLTDSRQEREAVLKVFAKFGIKELPDGRAIEEVVRVR